MNEISCIAITLRDRGHRILLASLTMMIEVAWAQVDAPRVVYEQKNLIAVPGVEPAMRTLIEQGQHDYRSFDEIPAIQYMRPEIPEAQVPRLTGDRFPTLVPDTWDVEQRAGLVARFFTRQCIPEADYEVTRNVVFGVDPPRAGLDTGGEMIWVKFMEALPLMRMMSGNLDGIEVDEAWARVILHSIAPDGLSYMPLVGRPWALPGDFNTVDVGPFRGFLHMSVGRMLGAVAVYYKITDDPVWLETGKGIVDGLQSLLVNVEDLAVPFDWVYGLDYKIPRENAEQQARDFVDRLPKGQAGTDIAWEQSMMLMYSTWVVTGLSQFYQASEYEPARETALRLARLIRLHYPESGVWQGHQHSNALAIHAFAELALATGDLDWGRLAERMYNWGKNAEKMGAIPEIGYFACGEQPVMEPCSVGDMTAIAYKLTELGLGDYYDDMDAYIRNWLMASQVTQPWQIDDFVETLRAKGEAPTLPVPYNFISENFSDRYLGYYSITTTPSDLHHQNWGEMCCTANCARALFYAWQAILDHRQGQVRVNLLLNRTSPWIDVDSYLPFRGEVVCHVKQPAELSVRMTGWIELSQVRAEIDGTPAEIAWSGRYASVGSVKQGQSVRFTFPIDEHRKTFRTWDNQRRVEQIVNVTFRGSDVVAIDPPNHGFIGAFQRAHLRQDNPRYIRTNRFVSNKIIDY